MRSGRKSQFQFPVYTFQTRRHGQTFFEKVFFFFLIKNIYTCIPISIIFQISPPFWPKLVYLFSYGNEYENISGYLNNCRIWGSQNFQLIEERPLHTENVTVYFALWFGCVIGINFFQTLMKGEELSILSAINVCYPNIFEEKSKIIIWKTSVFNRDGATSHTTLINRALCKINFQNV